MSTYKAMQAIAAKVAADMDTRDYWAARTLGAR